MNNDAYVVEYATGVSWESSANTMLGAKREATKYATYGCGSIQVTAPNGESAVRLEGERRWRHFPRCPW